jgi:CRP-like cAMP-binding protein
MEIYTAVLQWLSTRNIRLTAKEIAVLRSRTRHTTYKSFENLMEQDNYSTRLYFLNKGIVRLCRTYNGEDYTLGIVSSNDFLGTPLYIQSDEKSPCALESLTDIEVLEWTKEDVLYFKEQLPGMHKIELTIMERVFSWVQQHQMDMICLTAEERYRLIMEQQPELLLHIPLKYVASLLGIHTDSLSRIRKKYV